MKQPPSLVEDFLGYDIPEFGFATPADQPTSHWSRSSDNEIVRVNGRRPSPELCVNTIRSIVDAWRASGYEGASETTQKLFRFWFEEVRQLEMFENYRPYWVQREAIETIVYMLEIAKVPDVFTLLKRFASLKTSALDSEQLSLQRTMDGTPQLRVPGSANPLDLPQDGLPRYAIKAATGSGKTIVMAYLIFWSISHSMREKGSKMANNFLLLAPNIIVFERLKKDFANGQIFRQWGMCPPGWKNPIQVILRGEGVEPVGKNTLVLTNIQQLHDDESRWQPKNPLEKILGRAPKKDLKDHRHILERVRDLKNLMVLNDEAHHTHDDDLKWNQILLDLHKRCGGLIAWLDFSATPKMQNGTVFPWVVTDYPLAQAVEHQIVKFPVLVQGDGKRTANPEGINQNNAVEKYGIWIKAGVSRLRTHETVYGSDPANKPVMFIMCESVKHADSIGDWMRSKRSGFGFKDEEILVIHTKGDNEKIDDKELAILRDQANTIDSPQSPVKVVISVLVLREGWDVKNVSIILGLRPGNAKANILPEQAVGRGLRLMPRVSGTQILEILGTPAFHDIVRDLEGEGVIVGGAKTSAQPGIMIAPETSRLKWDILIPRASSLIVNNFLNIEKFDPTKVPATFATGDMQTASAKMKVTFEGMHGPGRLGEDEIALLNNLSVRDSLALITKEATRVAKLTDDFDKLYPLVRSYVAEKCFGEKVDLDSPQLASFLEDALHREAIAKNLGKALGLLIAERPPIKIEGKPLDLGKTTPFLWNRKHLECKKTVFNHVPVWNDFESAFAEFLDHADDVKAFSALAEYHTEFNVSYQKPSGALGQYFPDWVVKVVDVSTETYWIVETKGRVWDGTLEKDEAIKYWCSQITNETGQSWSYTRVNQDWWNKHSFGTFTDMIKMQEDNLKEEANKKV